MKSVTAAWSGSRRATVAVTGALEATAWSTREPAGNRGAALTVARRDDGMWDDGAADDGWAAEATAGEPSPRSTAAPSDAPATAMRRRCRAGTDGFRAVPDRRVSVDMCPPLVRAVRPTPDYPDRARP
jgi:hypothetical protein